MKPWIIACIFLFILAVIALASQRRNDTASLSEKSTDDQHRLIIYDVRTADEYAAGHLENAKLLPIDNIRRGIKPTESLQTAIGVYCRSGQRSSEAAEILRQAGYTNVTDLGGLSSTQTAGYKVVR